MIDAFLPSMNRSPELTDEERRAIAAYPESLVQRIPAGVRATDPYAVDSARAQIAREWDRRKRGTINSRAKGVLRGSKSYADRKGVSLA